MQGYLPPAESQAPDWWAEVSPAQLAVLGPAAGLPRADLATDGRTTVTIVAEHMPDNTSGGSSDNWVARNGQDEEMWCWNTTGFLTVKGVMDRDWLRAANTALDHYRDDPDVVGTVGASELWPWPDCSSTLAPQPADVETGRAELEETMSMIGNGAVAPEHQAPFRRMIAHPAVVSRLSKLFALSRFNHHCLLNWVFGVTHVTVTRRFHCSDWMLGPGWSCNAGSAKVSRNGSGGQQLHGGPVRLTTETAVFICDWPVMTAKHDLVSRSVLWPHSRSSPVR
eukprot:SAG31_NODE_1490_length_8134_cov_3.892968_5_plen_281_part_00